MFVPLTEYHGGGAAATIEPLDDHLDHYERRLMNLFGAGVQACFRGPRLYDTERGLAMLYNPLAAAITRTIQLPLYYTGIDGSAIVSVNDGEERRVNLGRRNSIQSIMELEIKIPAKGASWVIIKQAERNK